jgi:multiple antibiotic resistance protein
MNDFSRVAVALFAVLNAPGVLGAFAAIAPATPGARLRLTARVLALTFGALTLAAALNGPVLEWLDVSPENFQLAAGIVMLTLALRLLWWGEMGPPSASSPYWRGVSLVLGPVPIVSVLCYGSRFGAGTALGAAAIAILVTGCLLTASCWLDPRLGSGGRSALARFNGALIVLLAVELMVDGIQSI